MGRRIEVNKGDRYGKLTIIKEVEPDVSPSGQTRRKFHLTCDCGNTNYVTLDNIRSGKTTSCGCGMGNRTHGLSYHYLYKTWTNMKDRCYNSNNKYYKDYGGRGISVCDRWRYSFSNFLEDMGDRPEGLTLERRDVYGDYTPKNCYWATWEQQANNKRNSKKNSHRSES